MVGNEFRLHLQNLRNKLHIRESFGRRQYSKQPSDLGFIIRIDGRLVQDVAQTIMILLTTSVQVQQGGDKKMYDGLKLSSLKRVIKKINRIDLLIIIIFRYKNTIKVFINPITVGIESFQAVGQQRFAPLRSLNSIVCFALNKI